MLFLPFLAALVQVLVAVVTAQDAQAHLENDNALQLLTESQARPLRVAIIGEPKKSGRRFQC